MNVTKKENTKPKVDTKKISSALIAVSMLILLGLGIFFAIKLIQLKEVQTPEVFVVDPVCPSNECEVSIKFGERPTATPTPILECNDEDGCDPANDLCADGQECQLVYVDENQTEQDNRCRNPECPEEEDCTCPGVTPSPSPTPTASSTPTIRPTPSPTITGTPTPSSTPTITPTPPDTPSSSPKPTEVAQATPTPPPDCWDECLTSDGCSSSLECIDGFCVNPSCPAENDCNCPAPEIPSAGISWPTIAAGSIGILLIVFALLL